MYRLIYVTIDLIHIIIRCILIIPMIKFVVNHTCYYSPLLLDIYDMNFM